MILYRCTWVTGMLFGFELGDNMLYIALGIFDILLVWEKVDRDGIDS